MKPKHTILVVDDEPDVVDSVRDLLRLDYRVLGATGAAEGLEILEREEVHVVMTDQRMPNMSGVEFLARIRGEHPDAIRLLFTGYADIRAVIAAINQGNVYRYITKPWDPDELLSIIRDAVARYETSVTLKERLFFEAALRRYLAAPIVDELARDPAKLRLGGEKREVTVLFFDLAGFTAIAEDLPADELVKLVNGYLDTVVDAVFRHGGTLDKFVGDAVMAFWGAPIDQPDHAARACRGAIDMQRALAAFAKDHVDPRIAGLHARVGIHSGIAALGNLGSSTIMSYTAMGDTVNVAARLESVNKIYGTQIIASEETVTKAAWPHARELDIVRVTGRSKPLRIFEIWGEGDAPNEAALAAFREGLARYRERGFERAAEAFDRAVQLGDRACAAVMGGRAAARVAEPPPPSWDGTNDIRTK